MRNQMQNVKFRMQSGRGFTLIELLVVIAIIGILSTLAVVSLGNARTRARDSKRLSDMRSLQSALEIYYTDQGSYPAATASGTCVPATTLERCCLDNASATAGFRAEGACTAGSTLMTVPIDPGAAAAVYIYSRPDANTYYTQFVTETDPDGAGGPLVLGTNCLSTSGMTAEGADADTTCP